MGFFKKKKTDWVKNKQGYQAYETEDGQLKHVHRRVCEKRYKMDKLPPGFVIHHIDGNKENNAPYNLIMIHKKDHYRIHVKKTLSIVSHRSKKEEKG